MNTENQEEGHLISHKPPCCNLGAEYVHKQNLIHETENFFVVPTIGQMGREGYLLICTKKHFDGMGGMPQQFHSELEELVGLTRYELNRLYNSPVIAFEHGPRVGCHRGGGCLDHAHIHVLTVQKDVSDVSTSTLVRHLETTRAFRMERVRSFMPLHDISQRQTSSYMYYEGIDERRYTTEVNFPIPSQFMRQMIANAENRADWDWGAAPGMELFERTVDKLKNSFAA